MSSFFGDSINSAFSGDPIVSMGMNCLKSISMSGESAWSLNKTSVFGSKIISENDSISLGRCSTGSGDSSGDSFE